MRDVLPAAPRAPRAHVRLAVAGLGDDSVALVRAAELAFAPLRDDPLGVLAPAAAPPHPGPLPARAPGSAGGGCA